MNKPPNPNKFSLIKGITNMEDLVLYDKVFRSYANRIVEDKSFADDLVNDMYLKLHGTFKKGKTVNGGYIVQTLQNLYKNYIKLEKRKDKGNEIDGPFIPDTLDDVEETIEEKLDKEELYDEIGKRIETLSWYEKAILEINQTKSLLQLSKDSKISYKSLIYSKGKINNKLGITKKDKTEE